MEFIWIPNKKKSLETGIVLPPRGKDEVYDDAVARSQARLLFMSSIVLEKLAINGPRFELAAGICVRHCDARRAVAPLLEPVHVTVTLDPSAEAQTLLTVENQLSVVVAEAVLVDLLRIGMVWADELDTADPAPDSSDYSSSMVCRPSAAPRARTRAAGAAHRRAPASQPLSVPASAR